jgi:FixJ family two-component response regulator
MSSRSLQGPSQHLGDLPKFVAVIDDNPAVCEVIQTLLSTVGLKVETFGSAREFMGQIDPRSTSCLVLDVRLPGKNGLDFFDDLREAGMPVPVVFITGHGDIPMAVRAMKGGAVAFLPKPFGAQDLVDAVQRGIEQDRERRDREAPAQEFRTRIARLTARECEVMARVVRGLPNKEIGQMLGISEVTVKAHRRQVMSKMGAATLADLVRMSICGRIGDPRA